MVEKCVSLLLLLYQIAACVGVYNGKIVAEIKENVDELPIMVPYSEEFPYMIEVVTGDLKLSHVCGAVLIKSNVVLSAEHCFEEDKSNVTPTKYMLVAGNQIRENLDSITVQTRYIKQIIKHYQSSNVVARDLALLQTDGDFYINEYVKPINIPVGYDKNDFNGNIVVQLGWGTMENEKISDVLLSMQGYVRSSRSCIVEWYNEYVSVNRSHQHSLLCIQGFKRSVQCWGDSGGPTVLHYKNDPSKDILIGILTGVFYFENKQCDAKRPDHVENIAYFVPWITESIDKHIKS